jgi:hypothetical protein
MLAWAESEQQRISYVVAAKSTLDLATTIKLHEDSLLKILAQSQYESTLAGQAVYLLQFGLSLRHRDGVL